jgi:hypothetical protein
MSTPIIWVHEDALRQSHPVFSKAGSAQAIFVWDNDYFKMQNYTTKRLLFIYECLLEMDVAIIQGDTVDVLSDLSQGVIHTAKTLNPYFKKIIEALEDTSTVHVTPDELFSQIPYDADMGRFFRFWNKGRKSMMKPNAGL